MPKRSRSRSLSRNGASATAAKRRRKQEDEHERDSRRALARAAHRLTSNSLPGAAIIQRKKGDYRSIALQYDPETFLTETCLGEMQHVCACGAVRFRGESASMCCANGQVCLQHFPQPPDYLQQLYDRYHPHSKHFLENTRKYNCAFQMTSELNMQCIFYLLITTYNSAGIHSSSILIAPHCRLWMHRGSSARMEPVISCARAGVSLNWQSNATSK